MSTQLIYFVAKFFEKKLEEKKTLVLLANILTFRG